MGKRPRGGKRMTSEEGKFLLKVARSAIERHLGGASLSPEEKGSHLSEKRGAFVTLHMRGSLRGCIGRVEATEPIIQTVSQMAIEAAFSDPRFLPLTAEELPSIQLEISILSPRTKIQSLEEIQIGRDGLLIEKGFRTGLLLPQVATENRWTKEEFLAYACMKAGLSGDAWKEEGVTIYTFTAEIFSEESHV